MAYNTKPILTDRDGNPISQYFNVVADEYEVVEGGGGGNKVIIYNEDGTENNTLSLIPILDKLSQLTGTVIDEETRKSNELQRIAFYNLLQQMLADGELKGDDFEYIWNQTELGVKTNRETEYTFVDLKGDRGSDGVVTTMDGQFGLTIREDGNLYLVYADETIPPDMYINLDGNLIVNL